MLSASLFGLLFIVMGIFFSRKISLEKDSFTVPNLIFYVIALGFIIKLPLAYLLDGFAGDINLFKHWGQLCNDIGFSNVYFQEDLFLDYPPLYLYVLSGLDIIRQSLGIDFNGDFYTLIMKLPAMIADCFIAFIIYKMAKRKFCDSHSIYLAMLYFFNPLSIIDSTVWGQIEAIFLLLILVSLLKLNQNKFVLSGIFYAMAILLKPQAFIYAPVFLFYGIWRKNYIGLIKGVMTSLITILILSIPFTRSIDFTWLINRYMATLDQYNYYSVNAYNFMAGIGLNWIVVPDNIFSTILNIVTPVVATALCGAYMYFNRSRESIFIAASLVMSTIFMFSVKMHERYFFSAIILIFFAFLINKNKKLFQIYIAFSVVSFLNTAIVLYEKEIFHSHSDIRIILVSWATVLIYLCFVYYVFFGIKKSPQTIKAPTKIKKSIPKLLIETEMIDTKLYKKDYIIAFSIAIFYAFFSFANLGASVLPKQSWTPAEQETAIVQISGKADKMLYITAMVKGKNNQAVITPNITVEFSKDGNFYENPIKLSENHAVFTWKELSVSSDYKYAKFTADEGENILTEIAFVDTVSKSLVPLSSVNEQATKLIDEQDQVPVFPSYYDSMYFDEIYHARTAYEHILGIEPYENTHPPLGKLIISASISVFGMTPFGWRFPGALLAVLMLPVFYHIVKRLFGSSFISSCATLLFAFDFMHFAQTRIATIDTYSVFFILLMFDAMLYFLQADITETKLKKLLIPLALSGIFMGLGVASKWTVAYGAVGLAMVFFIKLIISYNKSYIKKATLSRILKICNFCVLFFIVIPFAIYFISFLPMTTLPHNKDNILANFFNYQTTMFNYHSDLVAEHYFASPWYEWPLSLRSIWYSVTNNYNGTGLVSTISSFGNPILWGMGLISMFFVAYNAVKSRTLITLFIVIAFLSVYLPWVLISRLTFVYHYFTAVPFLIMAIAYMMYRAKKTSLAQKNVINMEFKQIHIKINIYHIIAILLVVFNFILFAVFQPVLSGSPCSTDYANSLEWMPFWHFV